MYSQGYVHFFLPNQLGGGQVFRWPSMDITGHENTAPNSFTGLPPPAPPIKMVMGLK